MPDTPTSHNGQLRVRGARTHNLRGIDVDIPRNALVVFTGVSGSGKSSLAFDTIFAEGRRRYLDSLSAYTRQYLNQLERPDVDSIDGLPPTISIDQRSGSLGTRSTLATATEIHDYLRLLFARLGQAHCPQCGEAVARQTAQEIVEQILAGPTQQKVMILAPLVEGRKGTHRRLFERICAEGLVRARIDGTMIDAADPPQLAANRAHTIEAVIDRIVVKEGIRPRLQESVEMALNIGDERCIVTRQEGETWIDRFYSSRYSCPRCQLSFPNLEPRLFSFNSPYGACPRCHGLGVGAEHAASAGRARHIGLAEFETCPACEGKRLNPFARGVIVAGASICDVASMPVEVAAGYAATLLNAIDASGDNPVFSSTECLIARRIVPEIDSRLTFLKKVGLEYLELDRPARSLSGGEFQRARLAACLGSGMNGVCYVLDEPTIGLHPRDTGRLIDVLCELRDRGSSVLVVEHDKDVMSRADYLVDLGPGAGIHGGRLTAAGTPDEVARNPDSLTGRYLAGRLNTVQHARQREVNAAQVLVLKGARTHNLKNVTLRLPLGVMTCITGVSGSGKSSLINDTLAPAIRQQLSGRRDGLPGCDALEGIEHVDRLVEIDQSPLGRTGRSNPATYSGIWHEVRNVLARTRDARVRGFKARRFSFNSAAGRCETCKGEGTRRIRMRFLPDLPVTCPDCRGARFNRQTLAIRYAGRNAADILAMRIDEACTFFESFPRLSAILKTFREVGLGYLCLGQSSLTLSGGEAQRVRLATELCRAGGDRTLFLLDEPTTGLHPADVARLFDILDRLVDSGNTVVVIEHSLDVAARADWIIDLGPEGGAAGGEIVAEGPPSALASAGTHTGRALERWFADARRQTPAR